MKTTIFLTIMFIALNIKAQTSPFGFECNMPSGSFSPVNSLIGGQHKPESIAKYTDFDEAYFPVLIVYVQFPGDPGPDVSWWRQDINGVPQAPTFMGNIIAESKSTNYGRTGGMRTTKMMHA